MEEDIKILEERITMLKRHIKYYEESDCKTDIYHQLVKECKALENLLTRYKQLEEENKDIREDNYAYHQLLRMQNQREYRSKFLKDFQKEYGKNTMPDYDEIYERYDKQKKQLENSIPKSKIKEKIEELEGELTNEITRNDGFSEYREYAIDVLQELLEEGRGE